MELGLHVITNLPKDCSTCNHWLEWLWFGTATCGFAEACFHWSSGCQSQNCNRDMLNLVHSISKMPAPLQEKLPLKGGMYLQNIMLPHEIFHHLWANYNGYFVNHFAVGGEKGLQKFWQNFSKHPAMLDSALKLHPSFPKKCLPLGLHGDAVPTVGVGKTWAKMQLCFSWHSLQAQVFEPLLVGNTLAEFYKILCWSFANMASGTFPATDWNGNEFLGLISIVSSCWHTIAALACKKLLGALV